MNASPITATKAEAIRDRFLRRAAATRADAEYAAKQGWAKEADSLCRLAESQERMGHKQYESMTIRAL